MCSKRQPRRHFVIIVVALETYNDDTLGLKAHSASFNARMIYDRPVLIRSSCHSRCSFSCLRIWYALEDSGLNAFFPTLLLITWCQVITVNAIIKMTPIHIAAI